jgi:hypothetical protein
LSREGLPLQAFLNAVGQPALSLIAVWAGYVLALSKG